MTRKRRIKTYILTELYFARLIKQPLYFMHYEGTEKSNQYTVKYGTKGAAVWTKENGQRFIDMVGGLELVCCADVVESEMPEA